MSRTQRRETLFFIEDTPPGAAHGVVRGEGNRPVPYGAAHAGEFVLVQTGDTTRRARGPFNAETCVRAIREGTDVDPGGLRSVLRRAYQTAVTVVALAPRH